MNQHARPSDEAHGGDISVYAIRPRLRPGQIPGERHDPLDTEIDVNWMIRSDMRQLISKPGHGHHDRIKAEQIAFMKQMSAYWVHRGWASA